MREKLHVHLSAQLLTVGYALDPGSRSRGRSAGPPPTDSSVCAIPHAGGRDGRACDDDRRSRRHATANETANRCQTGSDTGSAEARHSAESPHCSHAGCAPGNRAGARRAAARASGSSLFVGESFVVTQRDVHDGDAEKSGRSSERCQSAHGAPTRNGPRRREPRHDACAAQAPDLAYCGDDSKTARRGGGRHGDDPTSGLHAVDLRAPMVSGYAPTREMFTVIAK